MYFLCVWSTLLLLVCVPCSVVLIRLSRFGFNLACEWLDKSPVQLDCLLHVNMSLNDEHFYTLCLFDDNSIEILCPYFIQLVIDMQVLGTIRLYSGPTRTCYLFWQIVSNSSNTKCKTENLTLLSQSIAKH